MNPTMSLDMLVAATDQHQHQQQQQQQQQQQHRQQQQLFQQQQQHQLQQQQPRQHQLLQNQRQQQQHQQSQHELQQYQQPQQQQLQQPPPPPPPQQQQQLQPTPPPPQQLQQTPPPPPQQQQPQQPQQLQQSQRQQMQQQQATPQQQPQQPQQLQHIQQPLRQQQQHELQQQHHHHQQQHQHHHHHHHHQQPHHHHHHQHHELQQHHHHHHHHQHHEMQQQHKQHQLQQQQHHELQPQHQHKLQHELHHQQQQQQQHKHQELQQQQHQHQESQQQQQQHNHHQHHHHHQQQQQHDLQMQQPQQQQQQQQHHELQMHQPPPPQQQQQQQQHELQMQQPPPQQQHHELQMQQPPPPPPQQQQQQHELQMQQKPPPPPPPQQQHELQMQQQQQQQQQQHHELQMQQPPQQQQQHHELQMQQPPPPPPPPPQQQQQQQQQQRQELQQQQQQYEDNVRQMQLSPPASDQTSAFSEPESLIPSLLSQLLSPPSPPLVSMASASLPECSDITSSVHDHPDRANTPISSTDPPQQMSIPLLLEPPPLLSSALSSSTCSSSSTSLSDPLASTSIHQPVSSLTSLLLSSSPPPPAPRPSAPPGGVGTVAGSSCGSSVGGTNTNCGSSSVDKTDRSVSYSTTSSHLLGLLSSSSPPPSSSSSALSPSTVTGTTFDAGASASLPPSSSVITPMSASASLPSSQLTSTSTTLTTTTTTTISTSLSLTASTVTTSISTSVPQTPVQSPEAAIASIMSAASRMILQHQSAGLLSPAAAQQYLEMMRTRATNYATATTAVHQKLLDDLNEELGKLANDGVEESVSQEVFAKFEHREILPGCCSHPGDIVEAGSLASLLLPDAWYPLTSVFPPEKLKAGQLSSLQLEGILYACQKHQTVLPNGHRAGFFIGDGAGVGKGRQVSGIILDNYCRGRLRHIWFSISADLVVDARRDLRDIGCHIRVIDGCNELDRNTRCFGLSSDFKEGVVFSTYATLVSSVQRGALRGGRQSRLQQLINWCGGKDFDGCLIFDECHKAKNFVPGREHASTKVANAVMTIQRLLPKARVIYCSATGVSDVKNMAFMERLGLWGDGAPFPSFENFLDCMSRKGLGAAEMLAMEMKASGMYVSRGLSFKQAEFVTIEAELTQEQMKTYDIAAYIWNELRKALSTALHRTNCGNNRIWTQYWSSHQRFFKQLCMGMKVPTIIQNAKEALQQGHCVVIGLQTTGEASLENELGRNKGVTGFVSLCREILTRFIRNYFQTVIECGGMNEERREDEWCKEAKSMLLKYASEIELPDSPLDSIIDQLGGPDCVAEMTGRRGRVVRNVETGCARYELRDSLSSGSSSELDSLNVNERNSFMEGRKLIAIISDAASTGISLHADVRATNQRRREHLTIELPWSADKAVQQLGRSHRSNQSSGPLYKLVTTNLGGERRFAAAVARRLQSLGALTKGDRRAATGADLTEFNFDTPYGRSALRVMYQCICMSEMVPGVAFNLVKQNVDTIDNFQKVLQDCLILMGIVDMDPVKFTVQVKKEDLGNVGKFLNRILGLPVMKQNLIFNYFIQCLEITIQNAKREGKYNEGLLDITASSVEMVGEPKEVFKDLTKGNTVTKLVVLNVDRGMKYEQALSMYENHKGKAGFYLSKGQPFGRKLCLLALSKDNSKNMFKVARPNTGVSAFEMDKSDLNAKYSKISLSEAEKAWQEQHEATEEHCMHGRLCRNRGACTVGSRCYFMHLLCGSIITLMSVLEAVIARHSYQMHLSKAESSIRVVRIQLNNGERVVGIRYPERLIGEVEKVLREHQLASQMQIANSNSPSQSNEGIIPNFNSSSNKLVIEAASPVIAKYATKAFTPSLTMHTYLKSNTRGHSVSSSSGRNSMKMRSVYRGMVSDFNSNNPDMSSPLTSSSSSSSSPSTCGAIFSSSNSSSGGGGGSNSCSSSSDSLGGVGGGGSVGSSYGGGGGSGGGGSYGGGGGGGGERVVMTDKTFKLSLSKKRRLNHFSYDNNNNNNNNNGVGGSVGGNMRGGNMGGYVGNSGSNCKQQSLMSFFTPKNNAGNTNTTNEGLPLGNPQKCPVCSMHFTPGMSNEQINSHVDNCLL